MKPVTCSCPKCRAMCAASTCLPTPEQARQLIRLGYAPRLATYSFPESEVRFVGPAPAGKEGARDLPDTLQGRCAFHVDGLCELHAPGLKPLEGTLAHHDRHWLPIRMHMAAHWRGKRFDSVMALLERSSGSAGA